MSGINLFKNQNYNNELYENWDNFMINNLGDDNEDIFDVKFSPNNFPSFHFEDMLWNKEKNLSNYMMKGNGVLNHAKVKQDDQAQSVSDSMHENTIYIK